MAKVFDMGANLSAVAETDSLLGPLPAACDQEAYSAALQAAFGVDLTAPPLAANPLVGEIRIEFFREPQSTCPSGIDLFRINFVSFRAVPHDRNFRRFYLSVPHEDFASCFGELRRHLTEQLAKAIKAEETGADLCESCDVKKQLYRLLEILGQPKPNGA